MRGWVRGCVIVQAFNKYFSDPFSVYQYYEQGLLLANY